MLSHLRLSENVAKAEEKRRNLPQSQDNPACYAKIRPAGRNSSPQEVAADGPAGTQIRESSQLDFHAEAPNSKWVTDISYIKTKQGVLYLSVIRDLYDNSIVSYKTATQQTVNLVLDTIRQAVHRKKEGRRGVAAPQRPRLSIHFPSIFQAD